MKTEIKPVGYSPENNRAAVEEVKDIFAGLRIPLKYKSIGPALDAYGVRVVLEVYGINFDTVLKLWDVSKKYGLLFNTIESDPTGILIITMATSNNQIEKLNQTPISTNE